MPNRQSASAVPFSALERLRNGTDVYLKSRDLEFYARSCRKLERVLSLIEMLLPKAVAPVDWAHCTAANWRCHSISGYLEPVKVNSTSTRDERYGGGKSRRDHSQEFRAVPGRSAGQQRSALGLAWDGQVVAGQGAAGPFAWSSWWKRRPGLPLRDVFRQRGSALSLHLCSATI